MMDGTEGQPAAGALLPRYRRPQDLGSLLDETIRAYRSNWTRLIGISALATIPYAVLIVLLSLAGVSSQPPGLFAPPTSGAALGAYVAAALAIGLLTGLVFGLCILVAEGAIVLVVDGFARGQRHSIGQALGAALRLAPRLLGATLLIWLGLVLLALAAIPLLLLTLLALFGLVPLGLLIAWLASPDVRRPWLKWLILLTTPMGLPIYYGVRWSLYPQAVVLEGAGPLEAIRRSSGLVGGSWFRVWGVSLVIGLITGVLQAVPGFIVSIVGLVIVIAQAARSAESLQETNRAFQLVANAGSLVGWILFGALLFIGLTLVFLDQRNRREGADLAERVGWLESGAD